LGKNIGDSGACAESWEVCDLGPVQSVVADGPLNGTTLHELVLQRGRELLGRHHPAPRFPLLLKFLDAAQNLSVQIHPDDNTATGLDPPDLGKTEAWVVLAAEPGATIHAGLNPGVDRRMLAEAIRAGRCVEVLHRFQPREGDCVFLPAGTVHALGAGLLVAEIQQASDTTYRLFDWDRLGPDGKPRPLQIERGLEMVDFERGPVDPQRPQPTSRGFVERLVDCDKFVLDRWTLEAAAAIGGDDRCHLVVVLAGEVEVEGCRASLAQGRTALLPAALGEVRLTPRQPAVLLNVYLPDASSGDNR
jgi:mannose-6-phosphate isomerase